MRRIKDQRMQVSPIETDPGRTEQSQPRNAITGVHERAGQCQHVDNFRQITETIDVDSLIADIRLPQRRQQRRQLRSATYENGNRFVSRLFEKFSNGNTTLFSLCCETAAK